MRGYCGIGLNNPKNALNVGSVLRAAGIFGAAFVAASGSRFGRASTDTMNHYRHLPLFRPESLFDLLPYDCVPVAVDKVPGAIPLFGYEHPRSAYYIFGQEDGTLGKSILDRCRDVVYVPMEGCMNLAASVNVVLYDRLSKSFQDNDKVV